MRNHQNKMDLRGRSAHATATAAHRLPPRQVLCVHKSTQPDRIGSDCIGFKQIEWKTKGGEVEKARNTQRTHVGVEIRAHVHSAADGGLAGRQRWAEQRPAPMAGTYNQL